LDACGGSLAGAGEPARAVLVERGGASGPGVFPGGSGAQRGALQSVGAGALGADGASVGVVAGAAVAATWRAVSAGAGWTIDCLAAETA
jgi:hypothetical protein